MTQPSLMAPTAIDLANRPLSLNSRSDWFGGVDPVTYGVAVEVVDAEPAPPVAEVADEAPAEEPKKTKKAK